MEDYLKLKTNETELVEEIIQWVDSIKISIIPISLGLSSFLPHIFTLAQSEILIKQGFNPKGELYGRKDDQARSSLLSKWSNHGLDVSKLDDNFWFCISQSDCDSNCPTGCSDQIGKMIYKSQFRVPKTNLIGTGGFSSVYSGQIHGIQIAAKFIDVTEQYRQLTSGAFYEPSKVIP